MSECIFCSIVRGAMPSTRVYEDDGVLAFLDVRPISRGHTLVVPKRHAATLDELDPESGAELFRAGHRIALAMKRSSLPADGVNLILNDGASAFQTVLHTHLHVIPRKSGDRLRIAAGFVTRRGSHFDETARIIAAGLATLD